MAYTHEYRWEYGSYAFYAGVSKPELQFRCTQVAVLYEAITVTLHKHGSPDDVKTWLKKYEACGLPKDMFDFRVVTLPGNYLVTDLNSMINTCGSVLYHIDRASKGEYTPESGT
jgi:hypothetical protein